jgi:hypothetical protein
MLSLRHDFYTGRVEQPGERFRRTQKTMRPTQIPRPAGRAAASHEAQGSFAWISPRTESAPHGIFANGRKKQPRRRHGVAAPSQTDAQ